MGFSPEIYAEARSRISELRDRAENEASRRREEFYRICPQYKQLVQELSQTCTQLAVAIMKKDNDVDPEEYRKRNLAIQDEMHRLLEQHGHHKDWLKPEYSCSICSDTGIDGDRLCSCLQAVMRSIAFDRLNAETPLALSTFESFSLNHYSDRVPEGGMVSPRKGMEITFEKCRRYAAEFTLQSPSLLLQGGVGLGKTHLSLAIAGEVINKGYGVIYGSVNNLFARIEDEHFGRVPKGDNTRELLCQCDLLILDDLGTEFTTQFTVSVLYDIVNTRLLRGHPTIISTNLDMDGLEQKYTQRVVSRITGSYQRFRFSGSDMRVVLRKARRTEQN